MAPSIKNTSATNYKRESKFLKSNTNIISPLNSCPYFLRLARKIIAAFLRICKNLFMAYRVKIYFLITNPQVTKALIMRLGTSENIRLLSTNSLFLASKKPFSLLAFHFSKESKEGKQ